MQIKGVVFLLAILILSGFVIAQTQIGKPSNLIEKKYSKGSLLTGWINISLNKEPANSFLETNFGGKINIFDFLKQNELSGDISYTCSPNDCKSDYISVGDGNSIEEFSLADRESKLIGLRFSGGGGFSEVSEFSININSDAPESNFRQLSIDILDDGTTDWQAYKSSGNFYNEDFGCYDVPQEQLGISSSSTFCEKINIPISPKVEIGAYVMNNTNPPTSANFVMSIISESGASGPSCEANTVAGGRIGCVPNFAVNEARDYYVCIKATTPADLKYKINSKPNGTTTCGYATTKDYPRDFEIFAKPGKFAAVGAILLNDEEATNSGSNVNLKSGIENYIANKYGRDCTEECIVPIRITSGKNQQQEITISNVAIKYKLAGVTYNPANLDIYNITETPATITSGFMQLFLDGANFSVPDKFGENTITLKIGEIGGTQIFSEKIEIERKAEIISVNPSIVIAALPTEFSAKIDASNSTKPTSYIWSFGDNQSVTTTSNNATHTYNNLGSYTLSLTVTDAQGQTSAKSFAIEVATPREAVNALLKKNMGNLNGIKSTIGNLSLFEQDSLNSILDFDNLEIQLGSVQQKNATAVSDSDYISAMKELVKIEIPASIETTKNIESILFYPSRDNINLNILQKIGGGDYAENDEKYLDAIVSWEFSNTQPKLSSKEFTANYENTGEEILNTFELKVNENPSLKGTYLIMPNFENLKFDKDYSQKEEQGNIYILLNGGDKITFSTTEDIEFSELPAFISPALSELSIQKGFIINTEKVSKQTLIILVVILVTFIGFIVYLVMQQWYKRKYESYLFKSKNDLYNIVSYIQNMKKQGVDDSKVSAGLKKSGWNSEQVTYIIRKYYGKRTGMFEIPLSNIINLFRGKADFNNYPKK